MHDPVTNSGLTVALALAVGVVAQSVARHLRMPGIVLLLIAGVALGPDGVNLIRPASLGAGLHVLVGFAIAIVLFEGGMSLEWRRLRSEARPIRNLVTWGVLITWAGAAIAVHLCMKWGWRHAILFGTLVIVTGPTVVTPLLRRVRVRPSLATVLEAEGVLIDAIGAIIAVVALEVVLSPGQGSLALGFVKVPWRLLFGALFGGAAGAVIALALRRRGVVPDGLENIFTLALVLAIHQSSNALYAESGIVSAVAAGLVVGNLRWRLRHELKEFKEQLTVLVIGMLFVLLAADVRLAHVRELGLPGIVTVLVLILVVRPLQVAACTFGSALSRRERLFIAWIAPRGIVAAAASSLIAERLDAERIGGGEPMRALVFLVIAATVMLQGATAGIAARLLGVRRQPGRGWVILGANPLGIQLGALLREKEEVVFIDANADACREARRVGFQAVRGKAEEENARHASGIDARRGAIGALTNEAVNLLFVQQARREHGLRDLLVGNQTGHGVLDTATIHAADAGVLFAGQADLENWSVRLRHERAVVERWAVGGDNSASLSTAVADLLLPLAVHRDGTVVPADDRVRLLRGDTVSWLISTVHHDEARAWLQGQGWLPMT